ncbi:alpha/beta hydrolase [Aliivibrio fischeri]|uniref:alpha/beta fold hydrolase n=1 Tax=Aliivibrio fischeri TaxID=668 RepID=UPI001F42E3F4|nr:alpha/beta fold hydrolase [Aliivibrio fischeri]MCE7576928.1 alpha/beta hydrolase [Aliivibrio fischeri]MCE7588950.1 alpha/beta hydrolase [Aliivibrio fischeri]
MTRFKHLLGLLIIFSSFSSLAAATIADEQLPFDSTSNEEKPSRNGIYSLKVPKNHKSPDGEKVDIYYFFHKATSESDRIGLLFFNFGGPGSDAIGGAEYMIKALPVSITKSFDLIFLDPRGTGKSAFANEIRKYANEVRKCKEKQTCDTDAFIKDIAPYMGTNAVADDMDALREHLGEDKISYLGYSYGTRLGSIYAERYPDRIRAAVLDSSMSPIFENEGGLDIDMAKNYEKIAEYRLNYRFERLKKLRNMVGIVRNKSNYQTNDGYSFDKKNIYTLLYFLVEKDNQDSIDWFKSKMYAAITKLLDTDEGKDFHDIYIQKQKKQQEQQEQQEQSTMGFVYPIVSCTDEITPLTNEEISNEDKYWQSSMIYGGLLFERSQTCLNWKAERSPIASADDINRSISSNILIIGGRYDPNTAYNWAEDMHKTIKSSTLITVDGYNSVLHGFSFSGTKCVDEITTRYLFNPSKKISDTTCKRSPPNNQMSSPKNWRERVEYERLSKP